MEAHAVATLIACKVTNSCGTIGEHGVKTSSADLAKEQIFPLKAFSVSQGLARWQRFPGTKLRGRLRTTAGQATAVPSRLRFL